MTVTLRYDRLSQAIMAAELSHREVYVLYNMHNRDFYLSSSIIGFNDVIVYKVSKSGELRVFRYSRNFPWEREEDVWYGT